MAFKIQTNTTSLQTFIADLVSFAVAQAGFTSITTFTHDVDKTARIIKKGDVYWSFWEASYTGIPVINTADITGVQCRMTLVQPTSFGEITTVAGQYRQAYMPVWANSVGPYTGYHFYTEGTAVHAILEVYTGVFTHLSFGSVTKIGTWTGGEYVAGSSANRFVQSTGLYSNINTDNSHIYLFDSGYNVLSTQSTIGAAHPQAVRFVSDAVQGDETDFSPITTDPRNNKLARFTVGDRGFYHTILDDVNPISFNLRAAAFPVYLRIYDSVRDLFWIAGYVPNVRTLNIKNSEPKSVVEIDWRLFPSPQSANTSQANLAPFSDIGFIYREVGPDVS